MRPDPASVLARLCDRVERRLSLRSSPKASPLDTNKCSGLVEHINLSRLDDTSKSQAETA